MVLVTDLVRACLLSKSIFKLLIGNEVFHTECEYHTAKKLTFYFSDRGRFFHTFVLRANTSASHDGCAEWMSRPFTTTTTLTTMADKLIIYVSQGQVLFDKQHTNYKDKHPTNNIWQSITNQFGYAKCE